MAHERRCLICGRLIHAHGDETLRECARVKRRRDEDTRWLLEAATERQRLEAELSR